MFEGLLQPMHLLVILAAGVLLFAKEAARTWQGSRGRNPWIQGRFQ